MSTLVTPDLARAVVEENLKLSGAFRQNLALKHGLPLPSPTPLQDKPAVPAKPAEVNVTHVVQPLTERTTVDVSAITKQLEQIAGNLKPPSPGGPAPAAASGLPTWAKAVAAGLTALGIGAGGYAIGNRGPEKPAEVAPVEKAGSLYQWLEDAGFHVPPEQKP